MNGFHAYRKNAIAGWSRIEMLLAVYDAAVESLDNGIDALNRRDEAAYAVEQMRVTKLILLLLDGLDADHSELAARVRDLCVFCIEQIATRTSAGWTHAREILATLREGFQGIRAEAMELEAQGAIPRLDETRTTVAHV